MRLFALSLAIVFTSLTLSPSARGHAFPDMPVRATFTANGDASFAVELDLRCFVEDPINEPYILNWVLEEMTEDEREDYRAQARALIQKSVEFRIMPIGRVVPEFDFAFTKAGGDPLEKLDDPVMITATWRAALPGNTSGYQLHANPECRFGVVFENELRGQTVERVQVLFPGESSYVLDLTASAAAASPASGAASARREPSNFRSHLRAGFVHIVPRGFSHILFIVGIFLLSRKRRPLLCQVAAFTAGHSLTLWLTALGLLRPPANTVDPLIAASIALIALHNIFRPKYTRWRGLVVFAFGLVHGLGFAAGLAAQEPAAGSLLISILGFNTGIELAQLAVIALAFIATAWLQNPAPYRKFVALPASILIAATGIWWTIAQLTAAA